MFTFLGSDMNWQVSFIVPHLYTLKGWPGDCTEVSPLYIRGAPVGRIGVGGGECGGINY